MLHYWLLLFGLMSPSGATDCGLRQYSSVDFATEIHRDRLFRCLKEITVSLQAEKKRHKHITVPGTQTVNVRGVFIRPKVFLTVASVMPLDVRTGARQPVQVLRVSQEQGLGLLNVSMKKAVVRFRQDHIQAGRVYFALDAAEQMHRVSIGAKGEAGLSYYWKVPIALPLGTPIVNAHGQPVSLVALQAAGASYLLPKESFDDFLSFRTSEGVCEASDISEKVSAERAQFERCFEASGMADPQTALSVTLRWWINRDGSVRKAQTRVVGSRPLELLFERCLTAVVNEMPFARPSVGECEIEYPLIFDSVSEVMAP